MEATHYKINGKIIQMADCDGNSAFQSNIHILRR